MRNLPIGFLRRKRQCEGIIIFSMTATLCALSLSGQTVNYQILRAFSEADGGLSPGSPIEASDGRLYVPAGRGMNDDAGGLLSMSRDGGDSTILKSFGDISNGPRGYGLPLIEVSDGRL